MARSARAAWEGPGLGDLKASAPPSAHTSVVAGRGPWCLATPTVPSGSGVLPLLLMPAARASALRLESESERRLAYPAGAPGA